MYLLHSGQVETSKGGYSPPTRVGQGTLVGFHDGGTIEPIQRHGVSRIIKGGAKPKGDKEREKWPPRKRVKDKG